MVLDKNYELKLYEAVGDWYTDCYPVRAARGYMFDYPTLKDIENNTY